VEGSGKRQKHSPFWPSPPLRPIRHYPTESDGTRQNRNHPWILDIGISLGLGHLTLDLWRSHHHCNMSKSNTTKSVANPKTFRVPLLPTTAAPSCSRSTPQPAPTCIPTSDVGDHAGGQPTRRPSPTPTTIKHNSKNANQFKHYFSRPGIALNLIAFQPIRISCLALPRRLICIRCRHADIGFQR
jgi:hypothetical protein